MAQQPSGPVGLRPGRRRHGNFLRSLRNANLRISDGRGVCRNTDLECGILLKAIWLRDLEAHSPLSPRVGLTAATSFSSDIGDRHREARGSPRGEGSLSAFRRRGDGHHAHREFTLADLVLRPLSQTAKSSAVRNQRLCHRPPYGRCEREAQDKPRNRACTLPGTTQITRWRCAKSTLRPNDLGASKGLLLANRLSPQFWRRTGVPLIIRPPV